MKFLLYWKLMARTYETQTKRRKKPRTTTTSTTQRTQLSQAERLQYRRLPSYQQLAMMLELGFGLVWR